MSSNRANGRSRIEVTGFAGESGRRGTMPGFRSDAPCRPVHPVSVRAGSAQHHNEAHERRRIIAASLHSPKCTMSIRFTAAALALGLSTFASAAADLPTTSLSINGNKLTAEVATTTATRATGLMNRFSLKPDHGMLFVFRYPQPLSFWMKNTYVALSIAYIDERGKIIDILDMAPQTESLNPSSGPALYALEMKKGWFKDKGIAVGATVDGLDKAPKALD
jgi:uncharacterized membrane protein (UPF0127 family)